MCMDTYIAKILINEEKHLSSTLISSKNDVSLDNTCLKPISTSSFFNEPTDASEIYVNDEFDSDQTSSSCSSVKVENAFTYLCKQKNTPPAKKKCKLEKYFNKISKESVLQQWH